MKVAAYIVLNSIHVNHHRINAIQPFSNNNTINGPALLGIDGLNYTFGERFECIAFYGPILMFDFGEKNFNV